MTVKTSTKDTSLKFLKYYVTLNNKKYFYTLKPHDEECVWVTCEAADISQPFLKEDIPDLLIDLPNLILAEKDYQKNQEEVIRFRVSAKDKKAIEKRAIKKGYLTLSAFLRDLALGI